MGSQEILFLVKFGRREHLVELENGKVYFSNSGRFNDIEKEQLKKGQGDTLDGRMLINATDVVIRDHESDKVINRIDEAIMNMGFDGVNKMPVFCLTSGFITDCEYYYSANRYKIKFDKEKERIIREHFGDADSALVIETPKDFIRCVTQAFEEKCYSELVRYYDMSILTMDRLEYLTGASDRFNNKRVFTMTTDNVYRHLYCKDDFFIQQQEFRFVVPEITITNPKTFDIEKGFKSRLVSVDDFFNGIEVGI
ncbi:hypothetical protein [Maledivibacter halophilus]|uniref:Uncharacterized protein n=1 Tax=Maledivibacter halophilus TaxID=36842 RepID=A0A1T5K3A7_9FIRM|nr:hypothetical protein [Maledivibacter halophilus]SKC58121.1 hypothetical protein SAMN02194393_01584 [Maledivibacter halophilus]